MAENTTNIKAEKTAADSVQAPEPTAAPAAQRPKKKTEKLTIPLDPNGGSDSVYLCVNGRNMVVRRGEPVEIPAEFAECYRSAQAQQAAAIRAQRAAMSED